MRASAAISEARTSQNRRASGTRGVGADLMLRVASRHAQERAPARGPKVDRRTDRSPGPVRRPRRRRADGAGWHQPGARLRVADTISLLPLPPESRSHTAGISLGREDACKHGLERLLHEWKPLSSAGLNPIDTVWQVLRQDHGALTTRGRSLVPGLHPRWGPFRRRPDLQGVRDARPRRPRLHTGFRGRPDLQGVRDRLIGQTVATPAS